ncbi:MAG: SufS family cysteine desulfurase [Nevskiales bacterium]
MSKLLRDPEIPPAPPLVKGGAPQARGDFDVAAVRAQFPTLQQQVQGKPLVYLDNAATTHKPQAVLDALTRYYRLDNSNVHRGVHTLSERATAAYEGAREKVRGFLNAASTHEIVFTRGTTESINLVAQSFVRPRIRAGDEILITGMEHHSNIVPWQLVCEQTGSKLIVAPFSDAGELIWEEFERRLNPERSCLVAVGHISNALGTINPIDRIIAAAHARDIKVLVDGAQAVAHTPVDVRGLDVDFYAFSSHKIYGPTGIGVLYAKEALLEQMPPWQGGGDMIRTVTFEKTTWNDLPYKFEAGTPHIAGAIGLGAALDWVHAAGIERIAAHEQTLLDYGMRLLGAIPALRLIGTARDKAGIISFMLDAIHAHDLGTVLDREGVAIRAGHHCAMPVMERYGIPATARASLACYNTREDLDQLAAALHKARKLFGL